MSYTKHGYTIHLGGLGSDKNALATNIEAIAREFNLAIPSNLRKNTGKLNMEVANELANKIKKKAIDRRKDWRGVALTDDILQMMQDAAVGRGNAWVKLARLPVVSTKKTPKKTSHVIGMPVYGRGAYDMPAAVAEAASAKAEWKFKCPSFEVWAAMTGYQDLPDGGPAFQKMCHYLLVDGRYAKTDKFVTNYFDNDEGGMTGDCWEEIEDPYWDNAMKGGGAHAYIGVGASAFKCGKGGHIGYNSQTTVDDLGGAGFNMQSEHGVEMPVSIRPGSKANWLRALGISFGRLDSHGTHAMQFTQGTRSSPREVLGTQMAIGNRLSAVIGLYFYANCRHASLNWCKSGTVAGKQYHVRMRLPNPNYVRSGNLLRVEEQNNAKSKEALGIHSSVLGGDGGFQIDNVFDYRGAPLLHTNLFMFPHADSLVTVIAPFFGDETYGWKSSKADVDRKYINNILAKNSELAGMMHTPEPESGLVLGWRVSQALWLYPHFTNEEWSDASLSLEKLPGWQPLPRWRDEFTSRLVWSSATFTSVADIFEDYREIGSLLSKKENYTQTELTTLRRFALDVPYTPSLSDPLAVEVGVAGSSVDVPEAREVGEDDEDDAPMRTEEDPEVLQDRDDVTGVGGQSEILRSDQVDAVMDFGINSIAASSMVQSLGFSGELPDSHLAADMNAQKKVAFMSVFADNVLEPGAPRTERDLNEHFTSADAQPWPHKDIYKESLHQFKTSPLDDVEEYAEKYGDVTNLYLRSKEATKIDGVEVNFGETKPGTTKQSILDEKITLDNPLFRRNLRRILLVYYHDSEIGFSDKKGSKRVVITADEKRKGMLGGVFRAKEQGEGVYKYPKCGRARVAGYYTGAEGLLWPAVFKKKPPDQWAECFDFNLHQGFDKDLISCMDNETTYDLSKIDSDMTVLDWITSPWHYAYLPYQPQKALFRDGETYSEGCRRCSRPFYEYNEEYSAYKYSVHGTQHWPTSYWQLDDSKCVKGAGNKDGKAPLPFHDPEFWLSETKAPKFAATLKEVEKGDASTPPLQDVDGASWHAWPLHEFQMPLCEQGYRGLNARRPGKLSNLFKALNSNKEPATFRKYYNTAYDESRTVHQERELKQGRLTWTTAKVKYGQTGYKLRRVSRYCNLCMDCASVLELAPGLFLRNYRVVKPFTIVKGNKKEAETNYDWWTNVLHKSGLQDVDVSVLHSKSVDHDSWARVMEGVSKYLKDTQHSLPATSTKFKKAPVIHIQSAVDMKASKAKRKAAMDTLQKMVKKGDSRRSELGSAKPTDVDISDDEFNNPVVRDLIADMARNLARQDELELNESASVYDSDQYRKEYRNEEWTVDDEIYKNCLRTRSWKPGISSLEAPRMQDYETIIFTANRFGSGGNSTSGGSFKIRTKGTSDKFPHKIEGVIAGSKVTYGGKQLASKSQWGGDGFVTTWNTSLGEDGIWQLRDPLPTQEIQTRHLRQSRLLITYTLHRPVTSDLEARLVMERIANVAHVVFCDDRYLSKLLLFGQKLVDFKRDKTVQPDSISSAHFGLIDKPRKKEALSTFYAKATGSSYIFDTYDTHVDLVDVQGGIEIGPQRKMPHFHLVVTLNHYTYIQIDYFRMNSYLELFFRAHDPLGLHSHKYCKANFELLCASGAQFYSDNEQPWVDIKLWPQDSWAEILRDYLQKQSSGIVTKKARLDSRNISVDSDGSD